MNTHRSFVALAMSTGCLLVGAAVAQEKEPDARPKGTDATTVEAWRKRGFDAGWMGAEPRTGEVTFAADPKNLRDALPAFRSGAAVKTLKGLPPVGAPFGLSLDNHVRVTDDDLDDLAGLKDLAALDLRGALAPGGSVGAEATALKKFAGLTSLTSLHLHSIQVSDAGLKDLAGLKNLTALSGWPPRDGRVGEGTLPADQPRLPRRLLQPGD